MTQAEIAGTEVIARYMGLEKHKKWSYIWIDPDSYKAVKLSIYTTSLDALAPVVKKVIPIIKSLAYTSDTAYEIFKGIYEYPWDAEKLFPFVVAAINFINDKMKEQNG